MPPFVPRLVGHIPECPRYVVRDRSLPGDWFWTGKGWSCLPHKALLFADIDEVNRQIARLYSDLLR